MANGSKRPPEGISNRRSFKSRLRHRRRNDTCQQKTSSGKYWNKRSVNTTALHMIFPSGAEQSSAGGPSSTEAATSPGWSSHGSGGVYQYAAASRQSRAEEPAVPVSQYSIAS